MTTPAPEKCPKCGNTTNSIHNDWWACGSRMSLAAKDPEFIQSDRCKIEEQRQRIAELEKKYAMLLQECERLKLEIEMLEHRI